MLRVTTLCASTAATSARYYAQYLAASPGEEPGIWSGAEAANLGLSGTVDVDGLELLLSGRDPISGTRLGRELIDRRTTNGGVVRAVAGFDATFSAPKSLSAWWALTGDRRLLEAHDVAVAMALDHLERFGSTTRVRSNGGRLHPDTGGLIVAAFRQTTSRADDPQIHTHAIVSAKVRTTDGRWLALDARYLLRHQRMLSDLYQTVLRAELTHRFGLAWEPVVAGKAEIAGVPVELREIFSKRHAVIESVVTGQVAEFRHRFGRDPSEDERSLMTRKAATETRQRKSGHGVTDLTTRWCSEAAGIGWTADQLAMSIEAAAQDAGLRIVDGLTVHDIVAVVSAQRSSWCRPDVIKALCQWLLPVSPIDGLRWAQVIERSADKVLSQCVDLDPPDPTTRRASDGRSVWIEPTAVRYSSNAVLAQEEHILTWAMAAQDGVPSPSATIDHRRLDVLQAAAAATVAGHDCLAVVVGPAGAGKTRTLAAAAADLARHRRHVFGVAPTAKAARVLQRDAGIAATTVAKLLHEWRRPELPQRDFRLPIGTTLIVDEAGMLSTPDLDDLVTLAEQNHWRLVLVGDHAQLQAVGRGGLFAEVCGNSRVEHLERLHRFTHRWEAAASLQLRAGDPRVLDAYEHHGRICAGDLDSHLEAMARVWIDHHARGDTVALVASTNDHVDAINQRVQLVRGAAGHLDADRGTRIAGGEMAWVGEIVATRRNDRRLVTTTGQQTRNRDTWTVTAIHADGAITVTQRHGHGSVTLPADYVRQHVRLGYAATEHGFQSETATVSICLASPITTRRGLYVAATRGRAENVIRVVTDTDDIGEARAVLEGVLGSDRADIPAVTQRRTLAAQDHRPARPAPLTPRCEIPDWFDGLLVDARADLATCQRHEQQARAKRAELVTDLNKAAETLQHVDTETDPTRQVLASAEQRALQTLETHADAVRQLQRAPWRQRRAARQAVVAAEHRAKTADTTLRQTRSATTDSVKRYQRAVAEHHERRKRLDEYDRGQRILRSWRPIGTAQGRVQALETWRRWAGGARVADDDLRSSISDLHEAAALDRTGRLRALHDRIQVAAAEAGIGPPPGDIHRPRRRLVGPDLSR